MATLRALVRWAVLTSLLAAILFIAAGSTEIPSLRDYVAVLSALLLFTMVAVDPELARERARPAGRDVDPGSRTASGFLFLVPVIFAAVDIGRLHQSDSVPPSWQLAAVMVFAAALILQAAAMIVNPFFSPALRIQAESGPEAKIDEKEALKRLARELGQSKSQLYRELQRERARTR